MRQQLGAHALAQQVAQRWSQPQSSRCSMASSRWFCTCQRRSRRPAGERSAFQIISLARSSPAASGSDKDRLTLRRRWPAGWMPVMHALSPYKALMPLWATSGVVLAVELRARLALQHDDGGEARRHEGRGFVVMVHLQVGHDQRDAGPDLVFSTRPSAMQRASWSARGVPSGQAVAEAGRAAHAVEIRDGEPGRGEEGEVKVVIRAAG